jgi:DNA-binding response OmpR family regulator
MTSDTRRQKIVLCVDDDRDSCELAEAVLGLVNYQVDFALCIEEGLKKARQNRYDLILLDLIFLNGSGAELCQQIRQFDKQTPILFYSGEAREYHIQKALGAGAQGYLVKPVDPADLLKSVIAHLDRLDED